MADHTVTIRITSKFKPLRSLCVAASQVSVIGIGVMTESAAMQWSGFVILALAVLVAAATQPKSHHLTPDEARTEIDRLEKLPSDG